MGTERDKRQQGDTPSDSGAARASRDSRTPSARGPHPTPSRAKRIALAVAAGISVVAIVTAAFVFVSLMPQGSSPNSAASHSTDVATTVLASGEETKSVPDEEALGTADPNDLSATKSTTPEITYSSTDPNADPDDPENPDPDNPAADPDDLDNPESSEETPPTAYLRQQASGAGSPEQITNELAKIVEEKREEKSKTQIAYDDIKSMLDYVTEQGTQEEIDRYTRLLDEYAQKLVDIDEEIDRYDQFVTPREVSAEEAATLSGG